MTRERASIFGDDDQADDIDVSAFRPGAAHRPDADAVRRVAEAGGFSSREPAPSAPAAPTRPTRGRQKTGRTHQVNIRASTDTLTRFLALADQLHLSQAETFERAVAALEEKIEDRD